MNDENSLSINYHVGDCYKSSEIGEINIMSAITDVRYEAVEPQFKRLRLAQDKKGNVYIMDNSVPAHSAPYGVVLAGGEIYDENMETYHLNEIEFYWVNKLKQFASELAGFH